MKCLPLYPSDEGRGNCQAGDLVRNNAGIGIGDAINARKVKAFPTEKVIISPLEAISPIDERYLADALESVTDQGSNVMVPYFGGRLTFQIIGITPPPAVDTAAIVTNKTTFTITEKDGFYEGCLRYLTRT